MNCFACSRKEQLRVRAQWRQCKMEEMDERTRLLNMAWLQTSPFRYLVELKKVDISSNLLSHLLHTWDAERRTFSVRGRVIPFTAEELSVIVGLGVHGEDFDYEGCARDSILLRLYKSVYNDKVTLENLGELANQVDGDGSKRAVAAFCLCSHVFTTGGKVAVSRFWPMLDDIDAIGKYAWGKVAYRFLCDSLTKAKLALESSGGRGEISIMGCSYALQAWLLEHFHNAKYYESEWRIIFPRFNRISVRRLGPVQCENFFHNNSRRGYFESCAPTAVESGLLDELFVPVEKDDEVDVEEHDEEDMEEFHENVGVDGDSDGVDVDEDVVVEDVDDDEGEEGADDDAVGADDDDVVEDMEEFHENAGVDGDSGGVDVDEDVVVEDVHDDEGEEEEDDDDVGADDDEEVEEEEDDDDVGADDAEEVESSIICSKCRAPFVKTRDVGVDTEGLMDCQSGGQGQSSFVRSFHTPNRPCSVSDESSERTQSDSIQPRVLYECSIVRMRQPSSRPVGGVVKINRQRNVGKSLLSPWVVQERGKKKRRDRLLEQKKDRSAVVEGMWVRRHISEGSQYVSKSVLDILHNDMNKKGDEMFLVPSCSSAPCIRWKDLLPLHPYTTGDFCSPNLVEAYCILLRKHAGNFPFNHSKSIFLSPTLSETLEKMCKMGGNESVDSVGKLMEGLAPLLEDINEETEMVFLPICVDNHWTLMVVVREDRRILYLDSRSRLNRNNLTMERMSEMVGEYICYNILDRAYHKGVWDCIKLDVPQQTQSFESGVYMLMFMVCYASTCAIPPFLPVDIQWIRGWMLMQMATGTLG